MIGVCVVWLGLVFGAGDWAENFVHTKHTHLAVPSGYVVYVCMCVCVDVPARVANVCICDVFTCDCRMCIFSTCGICIVCHVCQCVIHMWVVYLYIYVICVCVFIPPKLLHLLLFGTTFTRCVQAQLALAAADSTIFCGQCPHWSMSFWHTSAMSPISSPMNGLC